MICELFKAEKYYNEKELIDISRKYGCHSRLLKDFSRPNQIGAKGSHIEYRLKEMGLIWKYIKVYKMQDVNYNQ